MVRTTMWGMLNERILKDAMSEHVDWSAIAEATKVEAAS